MGARRRAGRVGREICPAQAEPLPGRTAGSVPVPAEEGLHRQADPVTGLFTKASRVPFRDDRPLDTPRQDSSAISPAYLTPSRAGLPKSCHGNNRLATVWQPSPFYDVRRRPVELVPRADVLTDRALNLPEGSAF